MFVVARRAILGRQRERYLKSKLTHQTVSRCAKRTMPCQCHARLWRGRSETIQNVEFTPTICLSVLMKLATYAVTEISVNYE